MLTTRVLLQLVLVWVVAIAGTRSRSGDARRWLIVTLGLPLILSSAAVTIGVGATKLCVSGGGFLILGVLWVASLLIAAYRGGAAIAARFHGRNTLVKYSATGALAVYIVVVVHLSIYLGYAAAYSLSSHSQ